MISAFGTQLLVTSMDAMKASLIKMWKVSPPSQFPQLLHLLEEMEVHTQSYDGANFNCSTKCQLEEMRDYYPELTISGLLRMCAFAIKPSESYGSLNSTSPYSLAIEQTNLKCAGY